MSAARWTRDRRRGALDAEELDEVLEAWRVNERVHVLLFAAVSDAGLACTLSTRGGRSVARQFAHVHNSRLYQLEPGFRVFRRGLVSMLGYLIAHESHHRGGILLTLKQCGHGLPSDVRSGIWAWDNV